MSVAPIREIAADAKAEGIVLRRPSDVAPAPNVTGNGHAAEAPVRADTGEGVSLKDFNAYMPRHSYIYTPSLEMWPSASVNARILPVPVLDKDGNKKTMPASEWLDKNRPVEQMTWAPGLPMLIPIAWFRMEDGSNTPK